jgi:hypothetical protein
MVPFLQMLSLRYYGIVHKADTKDYMQSLLDFKNLDKNDFRHSTYTMKMKKTKKVLVLQQSCRLTNPTSEFDDDDDIQKEEDT